MVCTAVVYGLNNFQIGFPTTVPTAGEAVEIYSYDLCNTITVGVEASLELTLECIDPGSYRYLIVQGVDTSAEKLCIAEVCALTPGQYGVTIILL